MYFPKWGIATGRASFEKLFADLGSIVSKFKHDLAYLNVIQQGDTVLYGVFHQRLNQERGHLALVACRFSR